MSTYTHRYVEVLLEQIDGVRWKYERLPDPETVVGKIYKISEYNLPENVHRYYTSVKEGDSPARWEGKDTVDKKWTLVKWYSNRPALDEGSNPYEDKFEAQRNHFKCEDRFGKPLHLQEGIMWCNNGGHIRDDYIGNGWGDSTFKDRGLPADVSEEVKKDIESDYHYGTTYVLLSEWETMFDAEMKKFVSEVKKRFRDEKLEEVIAKLNELLKFSRKTNSVLQTIQAGITNFETDKPVKGAKKKKTDEDDDDYMWEDSIDYMFEEEIWKLFNIQMEIDRCEFIVEDIFGSYASNDKIRIIYYLA